MKTKLEKIELFGKQIVVSPNYIRCMHPTHNLEEGCKNPNCWKKSKSQLGEKQGSKEV